MPSPAGAGVSLSAPRVSTKPGSSTTSVFWPDSASICATGSGFDAVCEPVLSSSSPHAAAQREHGNRAQHGHPTEHMKAPFGVKEVGASGSCGWIRAPAPSGCIAARSGARPLPGRACVDAYTEASGTPGCKERLRLQEMVIYGVSFDMVGKQPIVLLKAVDTNKFLPIWIGHPEAAAILMKLQGASTPRPMTHDLLFEMLGELDVNCSRVSVTELRENTFYASITLTVNGREVEIDSRPSDALALAVRSGAPIFAAEDVIAESAIEFEHEVEDTEEVVDKFKEFLDQVSPEDFQGGSE
jgi:bifunctional DNase/RNase